MTPLVQTVDDIFSESGALSRLQQFEYRPQQRTMAVAIAGALEARKHLIVEAPTGVGKSLAYLVPAILSGLKVVVSTGTKTLQEQILKRDLPLLREHLPVEFSAAGLKGISNYLCRRRFVEHDAQ
ncbi:MAG: DEAD/DEAH box helicase, partial [Bacteroidota bacterium]